MAIRSRALVALAVPVTVSVAAPGYAGGNETGPTYYKDVLLIMQENCQGCHRASGQNLSGLVAPMSFMDYKETRPWARAIARKVEAREMSPWFASALKGVFSNERGLTNDEIDTLVNWVDAGAPAGRADGVPCRWRSSASTSVMHHAFSRDFTYAGVSGMRRGITPVASKKAAMMAGGGAAFAASPPP